MDNEFYTLLTDRGMAKIASALADKKQIHLQKMAVGDSGGQYYEPTASQTKLRHEVWRGEMNTLTTAPNNPNWLIAELVLPEDVGGWYVREVGVFDDEGELIAIGKFPESYKPLLPGGCGKQVCIRLIMEVSNTTAVTLTVDPSIVLATRDYVDSLLDEHEHSTNHPDATRTQKGFTQLSNATDSDDETKAATPKAVKAAMAQARNHTHTWSQITDVPDGTLTQKGIVKLNSATDSTSTTEAATPSAVKAAMDKANAAAPASHTHAWGQITGVPDGTLTQKGIVKLNNATDSTSTTEAATPSAVKAAMDKANAAAPANHTHTADQISGVFPQINGDGAYNIVIVTFKAIVESGMKKLQGIYSGEMLTGSAIYSCFFSPKDTVGYESFDSTYYPSEPLYGLWRACSSANIVGSIEQSKNAAILAQRIPIGSISRFSNINTPYAIYTNELDKTDETYHSINFTCDIEGIGTNILFTASENDPEQYGKKLFQNAKSGMYGEIRPRIIPVIVEG
ncbi:phage tail protein [Salmonella enterica subsp. salamae]|nr:phage tail protein [Salmonella enterica]EBP4575316.1 phage tail protein [Salmonella enterica]ECJ5919322.1 phage tail protein [Salmonella enterica subsp. salamae]ECW0043079.1 phage tail protein [Salmonella enterica]EDX9486204.1 phage tail protein [Salmonella enterica]